MRLPRLLTVVGARPQFVKAAAVSRAIAAHGGLHEAIVHTGQHFDPEMSKVFFDELGIAEPAINLGIHGGGHGTLTGRMLAALEPVMEAERPDLVIVYGDTDSTLAAALAAAKLHIPVAHFEAGMRSFNRRMPEEINRVLTDHVSTLLLTATETALRNLEREGIAEGVRHVGDVMYDSALFAAANSHRSTIIERLGLAGRRYAVATLHRAENTDDGTALAERIAYLKAQARKHPVVFPLHPRTRQRIAERQIDLADLIVCEPLGYLDMHRLLRSATTVFTDSGGVQNEAYFHRVPCVTLRSETEWVETVAAGWNRLWRGPDYAPRREIPGYGDGHAADRAVRLIADYLQCRTTARSRPSS